MLKLILRFPFRIFLSLDRFWLERYGCVVMVSVCRTG